MKLWVDIGGADREGNGFSVVSVDGCSVDNEAFDDDDEDDDKEALGVIGVVESEGELDLSEGACNVVAVSPNDAPEGPSLVLPTLVLFGTPRLLRFVLEGAFVVVVGGLEENAYDGGGGIIGVVLS